MPVIIKGKMLDNNKPMICVPIIKKTKDEIIDMARTLVSKNVGMIEWRVDYFEDIENFVELKSVLEVLRGMAKETILLVTLRSLAQGGNAIFSSERLKEILFEISACNCADIIDVEYFTFKDIENVVSHIQMQGANVMVSHHDFEQTPKDNVIDRLLEEMEKIDADIIKFAFMTKENSDLIRIFSAQEKFCKSNSLPLVAIAMGEKGKLSRLSGSTFGSCITFASMGEESAPGQIPYETMTKIMEVL